MLHVSRPTPMILAACPQDFNLAQLKVGGANYEQSEVRNSCFFAILNHCYWLLEVRRKFSSEADKVRLFLSRTVYPTSVTMINRAQDEGDKKNRGQIDVS